MRHALSAVAAAAILSAPSHAGPLASDPAALQGRTVTLSSPSASITADTVVYLPGSGGPASVGNYYLYAFQFYNTGPALDHLALTFPIGGREAIVSYGVSTTYAFAQPGGAAPTLSTPGTIHGRQVEFAIEFSPPLATGTHSGVVWMAAYSYGASFVSTVSPTSPIPNVLGGGLLHGPSPAPGAVGVLAVAGAFAARRRR